jgi:ferritin
LIRFINECGGFALIPALDQAIVAFKSLKTLFEEFPGHEIKVSNSINDLVDRKLKEKIMILIIFYNGA